jgi:iron complex outermembrane receptor protein
MIKNQYLMILCFASQAGYAAEYSNEEDYYQELPVVLSASRLSQPLSEAPNAMTVIDRKMIVASGFRTIADLFKLVPGMYVSYYKGSQPIVSYHGSTDQYARRMQVMIDGRSVYLPPASTVNWSDLPITIDDIERIEVIRGPAAASYGANSTQGVISITTRDAGVMDGKSVSFTHGDKGVNDVSTRFGSRGEQFDYRMTLAYTADNGYDSLATPPNNISVARPKATGLLNNSNDSNQARLLNYRADYHPNAVDRYDIQFGFNHDVQGVGFNDKNPSAINPVGTNGNTFHDLIGNSDFMQLGWIRQLEDNAELTLRYSHTRQDQYEAFPVYLSGRFYANPVVQSLQTSRDEIEVQHTLPLSSANRLVYGADYRIDRVSGQGSVPPLSLLYSSSSGKNKYRIFGQDEWRITPKLLLNLGGMYEKNGLGQQNTSPRAALNFHFTPQQTLRMGVSVAYRTPSMVETNYPLLQPGALFIPSQTVNSPGLQSEKMLSHEIGYLGEFPDWATSLDLRLFSDQLSNGIYLSSTSKTFVNGMSAAYQGLEATVKHEFGESSDLTVNFAHELAVSDGPLLAAAGQKILVSSNPLNSDILSASTPRNSASLLYVQRLSHDYSFSASCYYQGAMQPYDRGAIDYQPIQRRMDVRVAKAFNMAGGVKGDVALVLQNLLDQGYTEYIASNLFNRRGYVTLTLNW